MSQGSHHSCIQCNYNYRDIHKQYWLAHLDIRLKNVCLNVKFQPVLIDFDRSKKVYSRVLYTPTCMIENHKNAGRNDWRQIGRLMMGYLPIAIWGPWVCFTWKADCFTMSISSCHLALIHDFEIYYFYLLFEIYINHVINVLLVKLKLSGMPAWTRSQCVFINTVQCAHRPLMYILFVNSQFTLLSQSPNK